LAAAMVGEDCTAAGRAAAVRFARAHAEAVMRALIGKLRHGDAAAMLQGILASPDDAQLIGALCGDKFEREKPPAFKPHLIDSHDPLAVELLRYVGGLGKAGMPFVDRQGRTET